VIYATCLHLLIRAVIIHHLVKDGLLDGQATLLPKPLLGYSLVMLALPDWITFLVDSVCLVYGGEQPSCDRLHLARGCFDID
jgi:hypothetical protein